MSITAPFNLSQKPHNSYCAKTEHCYPMWFSLLITKLSVKHVTCVMCIHVHQWQAWSIIAGICCMFEMNQMLPIFFVRLMPLKPDIEATGSGCLVPGTKIVAKLSRLTSTIRCMINGSKQIKYRHLIIVYSIEVSLQCRRLPQHRVFLWLYS